MGEQTEKKKGWISFRVKPDEYDRIHAHFKSTTCRKLSVYARNVLLQKPVLVKYRNKSADEFLAEMNKLKKDLNGVANNFNQAVHKLHTLDRIAEFRTWIMMYENSRQSVEKKIDEIKIRMDQIHKQWSQE
ncbi:MAG: plasmid mobilization relaxosome protein MobC [Chitinophagaceae bacterium]